MDIEERRIDEVTVIEMWTWRRMERISWKDRVMNEKVIRRVEGRRRVLYVIYGSSDLGWDTVCGKHR